MPCNENLYHKPEASFLQPMIPYYILMPEPYHSIALNDMELPSEGDNMELV